MGGMASYVSNLLLLFTRKVFLLFFDPNSGVDGEWHGGGLRNVTRTSFVGDADPVRVVIFSYQKKKPRFFL